ncbi:unnamed protein product [Meloidogyne enterolobii]|uniref:Uncharacterized protein n=1 Tax=Meloidogyne enterolobii TaxID=390850 RepID=A0ACB1A237_MELEN
MSGQKEFGEQDIASMLKIMEEAKKHNEQARQAYLAQDYRKAVQFYHRCMLSVKAVVQLTNTDLREMARALIDNKTEDGKSDNLQTSSVKTEQPLKQLQTEGSLSTASSSSRIRQDSTTCGQEILTEAKDLMTKCYNNLAACLLARDSNTKEDFMRAVFYCDNVLKDDPNNEKALFRKGVALMRADSWDKAIEQLEKCKDSKEILKNNTKTFLDAQAKLYIIDCNRYIEEDRRRRDAEIRANFAKARAGEVNFLNCLIQN